MRFIDVVLDHRQTLGHQLSLNFLLSQDDLNPGLQVKNTEICLKRREREACVLFLSSLLAGLVTRLLYVFISNTIEESRVFVCKVSIRHTFISIHLVRQRQSTACTMSTFSRMNNFMNIETKTETNETIEIVWIWVNWMSNV